MVVEEICCGNLNFALQVCIFIRDTKLAGTMTKEQRDIIPSAKTKLNDKTIKIYIALGISDAWMASPEGEQALGNA